MNTPDLTPTAKMAHTICRAMLGPHCCGCERSGKGDYCETMADTGTQAMIAAGVTAEAARLILNGQAATPHHKSANSGEQGVSTPRANTDYVHRILFRARTDAATAQHRYPQPNITLLKLAEEAGEVVKTGVHLSEGRDFSWADFEVEVVQTIAMCLRLLVEGDETIGLIPPPGHHIGDGA